MSSAKSIDAPGRTAQSGSGEPREGSREWKASWCVDVAALHGEAKQACSAKPKEGREPGGRRGDGVSEVRSDHQSLEKKRSSVRVAGPPKRVVPA